MAWNRWYRIQLDKANAYATQYTCHVARSTRWRSHVPNCTRTTCPEIQTRFDELIENLPGYPTLTFIRASALPNPPWPCNRTTSLCNLICYINIYNAKKLITNLKIKIKFCLQSQGMTRIYAGRVWHMMIKSGQTFWSSKQF